MLLVVLVLILVQGRTLPPAPLDQGTLASILTTGTDAQKADAAQAILGINRRDRSEGVVDAVIKELRRQRAIDDDRERRYDAGEKLAPLGESEYVPSLLQVLAESDDPKVIESLCLFIATGDMVDQALARFGERAVPALSKIALDRSMRSDRVSSALHTFARMLQARPTFALSNGSRELFTQTARRYLTEKSSWKSVSVVVSAGELAIALRDGALVARVRVLSLNSAEVKALGFEDDFSIGLVQRLLTRLLTRLLS